MKRTAPLTAAALISGLACVGAADAATITYDFDGGTAAGVSDFGSGVTVDDASTSGLSLVEDRAHRVLGNSASTLAVTINIPTGVIVNLTELDFTDGIDSGAGGNFTYSQWDLAVSTGSGSPATGSDSVEGTGFSSTDNEITLTGLTGLTDTSVTFTWTLYYGTSEGPPPSGGNNSSRHFFIDDIVFTGSVVPEPGSLALLGLGGVLVASRRRRTQ